jgi:hypothetical protein
MVAARWPRLALAAGLAALLAAVMWWLATPALTGFGTADPQPPAPSPPARAAHPTVSATASATASVPTPLGDTTLPGEPVRLTIPTQGVQAAVVPVEAPGGVLDVPDNIHQAGWWTGSALAGATAGTTVLDGHVDSVTAGPGALFGLQELREGDPLQLDTATRQIRYAVTGRRIINKSGPLPAEFFSAAGGPRLVLISCGGPFDRATGSYRDNIVIIAVPTA